MGSERKKSAWVFYTSLLAESTISLLFENLPLEASGAEGVENEFVWGFGWLVGWSLLLWMIADDDVI